LATWKRCRQEIAIGWPKRKTSQRPERNHVQGDPVEARDLVGGEVNADEELVQEGERDGQVRVQVDCVPGLVGSAACGRHEPS
jgi:hypothetical protein